MTWLSSSTIPIYVRKKKKKRKFITNKRKGNTKDHKLGIIGISNYVMILFDASSFFLRQKKKKKIGIGDNLVKKYRYCEKLT